MKPWVNPTQFSCQGAVGARRGNTAAADEMALIQLSCECHLAPALLKRKKNSN